MSAKGILKELEPIKLQAVKIIANNPKDIEAKELLEKVEMTIEVFKEEASKNIYSAYGSIEVEIENYRFKKDERNRKGIEIYKVDIDGLYEYLETKSICKSHIDAIKDIDSLKLFARDYYNKIENIGE